MNSKANCIWRDEQESPVGERVWLTRLKVWADNFARLAEARVVEEIEDFHAELYVHVLTELGVREYGEVHVIKPGQMTQALPAKISDEV